jgi:hypothetical protein
MYRTHVVVIIETASALYCMSRMVVISTLWCFCVVCVLLASCMCSACIMFVLLHTIILTIIIIIIIIIINE